MSVPSMYTLALPRFGPRVDTQQMSVPVKVTVAVAPRVLEKRVLPHGVDALNVDHDFV